MATESVDTRKHPEDQYLGLMADILESDDRRAMHIPGNQGYSCLLGYVHRYNLQRDGFPLFTTKSVAMKSIAGELKWFLDADTNIGSLTRQGIPIWNNDVYRRYQRAAKAGRAIDLTMGEYVERIKIDPDFAAEWGEAGPIYGVQWRRWKNPDGTEIDQLQTLVNQLRDPIDKYRKSNAVSAWNPSFGPGTFPDDERKEMVLPPCHVWFQTDVDEQDRLTLFMVQRSADMFLGVPFNVASYALLTHLLAQVSGLEAYQLIHMMTNAHVYHSHFDAVKEQLAREPRQFPRLNLDPSIQEIDDFTVNGFQIEGYNPHPRLRAEMLPVGGIIDDPVLLDKNKP